MNLKVILLLVACIGQSANADSIIQKNIENVTKSNVSQIVQKNAELHRQAKKLFVSFNGMKPKDVPGKTPDSVRISVIGDSITNGLGHWPQKLADLINSPYIEIADFAASGSTISKSAFKDKPFRPYRFTDQWEMFKASKPDIVMFMLGSCDAKLENWAANSAQNFEEEYYHWLEYLSQMKDPHPTKVYAIIPPPILPCITRAVDHMAVQVVNDFFPSKIPHLVARLNTAPDVETRGLVEIIDVFGFMGGHDINKLNAWCADPKLDGFHYGFDKIAESIYTHLMVTLDMDAMHEDHVVEERKWLKQEGQGKVWRAGEIMEVKNRLNLTQLSQIDLPVNSDKKSAFSQTTPINENWNEADANNRPAEKKEEEKKPEPISQPAQSNQTQTVQSNQTQPAQTNLTKI